MALVYVSTMAAMHCSSEQPKNKRRSTAYGRNTFEPPFDASPPRSPVHQKSLFGKMHLFATTQGGGNGVFASSLRRPDTRLSIASAFLSARLSDLLSALLIWMIRFRCNWFTAICLPSLSIMSACLSVFVCSNADCNWFILCSVDCVCSLSVCVCGCLLINWSN